MLHAECAQPTQHDSIDSIAQVLANDDTMLHRLHQIVRHAVPASPCCESHQPSVTHLLRSVLHASVTHLMRLHREACSTSLGHTSPALAVLTWC